MGILDIVPELLLLVAENLSLEDLSSLRSTCSRVQHVLNSRFRKLCLQDVSELTALQWAAVRDHAELIKFAISNGAEIDTPFRGQLTIDALGASRRLDGPGAIYSCSLANNSADIKIKEPKIRTPLFLAACSGSAKAIEVLLELGARMQCFGEMESPLRVSAKKGDVECMQAFARAGFDINARGARDRTILHEAMYGGVEVMKYILQLEGGTNLVNARTSKGLTPLHFTHPGGDFSSKELEVELLLQHGADIYARENDGSTPAHYFAYGGDVGSLRLLIAAGFDLNSRGLLGLTILHFAVHGGKEMMEYLLGLEGGRMIIDVGDNRQRTPMHHAFMYLSVTEMRVLLRHGAARIPLPSS